MLQPLVHSFSVGTVHTVRDDFFFGLSLFSLEVAGDMDWRVNNEETGLVQHKAYVTDSE